MNDTSCASAPVESAIAELGPSIISEPTPPQRHHWPRRALTLSLLVLLGGGVIARFSSLPILNQAILNRVDKSAELLDSLTVSVTPETLAIRVEGNGTVISKDTVNLSPKITGRLDLTFPAKCLNPG